MNSIVVDKWLELVLVSYSRWHRLCHISYTHLFNYFFFSTISFVEIQLLRDSIRHAIVFHINVQTSQLNKSNNKNNNSKITTQQFGTALLKCFCTFKLTWSLTTWRYQSIEFNDLEIIKLWKGKYGGIVGEGYRERRERESYGKKDARLFNI